MPSFIKVPALNTEISRQVNGQRTDGRPDNVKPLLHIVGVGGIKCGFTC